MKCRHLMPVDGPCSQCGRDIKGVGPIFLPDTVNHPPHYTQHPSGVECIQITEHMGFNLGNAVKCIWRADLKGNSSEDLEKARWYITREIEKRRKQPMLDAIEARKGT